MIMAAQILVLVKVVLEYKRRVFKKSHMFVEVSFIQKFYNLVIQNLIMVNEFESLKWIKWNNARFEHINSYKRGWLDWIW